MICVIPFDFRNCLNSSQAKQGPLSLTTVVRSPIYANVMEDYIIICIISCLVFEMLMLNADKIQ